MLVSAGGFKKLKQSKKDELAVWSSTEEGKNIFKAQMNANFKNNKQ